MEMLIPLGAVFALAYLCENLTEYLFKDLLKAFKIGSRYLKYISALLGISLCLAYGVDIFEDLLGVSALFDPVGEALTGIILGRGSNYIHDFYKTYVRKEAA